MKLRLRRKPPRPCVVLLDPDGFVCGFRMRSGEWSHVLVVGVGYTEMAYGPVRKRRKAK